jgi:hypothetical protein
MTAAASVENERTEAAALHKQRGKPNCGNHEMVGLHFEGFVALRIGVFAAKALNVLIRKAAFCTRPPICQE